MFIYIYIYIHIYIYKYIYKHTYACTHIRACMIHINTNDLKSTHKSVPAPHFCHFRVEGVVALPPMHARAHPSLPLPLPLPSRLVASSYIHVCVCVCVCV